MELKQRYKNGTAVVDVIQVQTIISSKKLGMYIACWLLSFFGS